jgi:putative NADH-flavin reductase
MRILILGATGRTGKLLLKEALNRGHAVTVLVNDSTMLPTDLKPQSIYEGSPLNKYTLAAAMRDCEAVLGTLNISRISDYPWAKLRTPKDFLSLSMKNMVELSTEKSISRIIITTAWGVAETWKDLPFWFRSLIKYSNIRYPYKDHERQEKLLKNSSLNWTIVRPVGLTDSEKDREVQVTLNNNPKPALTISRQNVACFMLDVLENNLYNKQCPTISER